MKWMIKILALAFIVAAFASSCSETASQPEPEKLEKPIEGSARYFRGASPYQELKNEPPPKLIVDPPLPDLLSHGVVWIQWRVENVHILPVFGKEATDVTPRLGHLHVQVDDLPWWWADPGDINTIDMAGLPPGPHKVKISLVDPNHNVYPGQVKLISFTIPDGATPAHAH